MRPKKSLGQHFLVSQPVVRRVLETCRGEAEGAAGILEIGPGRGALTGGLCALGRPFWAVELDYEMGLALQEHMPAARVILGDARELDLAHVALESGLSPWLVAGNLPYNAATEILGRILASSAHVAAAVVMLQREVAQKLCAAEGGEGYGQMAAGAAPWWERRVLFTVQPGAFRPEPAVTSAVCLLRPRTAPLLPADSVEGYRRFVSRAFAHPRKTLSSNLAAAGLDRGRTGTVLTAAGLTPDVRPGRTPAEAFVALFKLLCEEQGVRS